MRKASVKKNILSKEVYAEKVKELNIKINKLKSKQQVEGTNRVKF